jgi:adenylate cyclase
VTTEIERRFLPDGPPPDAGPGEAVRQGYLARDGDAQVRVRQVAARFVLTVKAGTGRDRVEVEKDLSPEEFAALWPVTRGRRVEKTRHRLDLGPHVAEIDVFHGHLEGLVIVEVEFPSPGEADAFVPPGWFGEEITGRPEWGNAALASEGRPDR